MKKAIIFLGLWASSLSAHADSFFVDCRDHAGRDIYKGIVRLHKKGYVKASGSGFTLYGIKLLDSRHWNPTKAALTEVIGLHEAEPFFKSCGDKKPVVLGEISKPSMLNCPSGEVQEIHTSDLNDLEVLSRVVADPQCTLVLDGEQYTELLFEMGN